MKKQSSTVIWILTSENLKPAIYRQLSFFYEKNKYEHSNKPLLELRLLGKRTDFHDEQQSGRAISTTVIDIILRIIDS